MTHLIDYLTSHPLLLGVAAVISLMIVLSFARRIIHFLFVLIAIGILYIAWVSWHGGNPKEKAEKAGKSVKEAVYKGKGVIRAVDGLMKHDDRPEGR